MVSTLTASCSSQTWAEAAREPTASMVWAMSSLVTEAIRLPGGSSLPPFLVRVSKRKVSPIRPWVAIWALTPSVEPAALIQAEDHLHPGAVLQKNHPW